MPYGVNNQLNDVKGEIDKMSETTIKEQSLQGNDVVRVQFDFPRSVVARIDALKQPLNATSRADVMKQIIPCGEMVVQAKLRGAKIFIEDIDGSTKQVEFLW